MKTVKWFKEGDNIPSNARLIKTEQRYIKDFAPEGGVRHRYIDHFLYEYEIKEESNKEERSEKNTYDYWMSIK